MPTNDHAAGAPLFTAVETDRSSTVTLTFEGQPLRAVTSAPRAPYCMMGVCFECLVEIDGKPSRQACLTPVRDGMVIKRQQGASAIAIQEEVEA